MPCDINREYLDTPCTPSPIWPARFRFYNIHMDSNFEIPWRRTTLSACSCVLDATLTLKKIESKRLATVTRSPCDEAGRASTRITLRSNRVNVHLNLQDKPRPGRPWGDSAVIPYACGACSRHLDVRLARSHGHWRHDVTDAVVVPHCQGSLARCRFSTNSVAENDSANDRK